jgi:DNA-binding NarL/FixJ family response regulator
MTVRLLLVDDHSVVRSGLRAVLEAEPDLDVVGEATVARLPSASHTPSCLTSSSRTCCYPTWTEWP